MKEYLTNKYTMNNNIVCPHCKKKRTRSKMYSAFHSYIPNYFYQCENGHVWNSRTHELIKLYKEEKKNI